MYGERGRIGLVTLASDSSVLPEYLRLMPEGAVVYPAPILLPRGEVTPVALAEMLEGDQLERAADLLTWADVGIILFACTSGSLVHGVGWDRTISARITGATGVPATTTTTAVLDALHAVNATTVAVATPYLPEINVIERRFLEESGFAVSAIAGLDCGTDREIGQLTPEDARALVAQVDAPEADAIFISCTNFHCLSAVAEIERTHGKPVITSNLAGAWATLRYLGIDDDLPGAGHLFTLPARERMLAT